MTQPLAPMTYDVDAAVKMIAERLGDTTAQLAVASETVANLRHFYIQFSQANQELQDQLTQSQKDLAGANKRIRELEDQANSAQSRSASSSVIEVADPSVAPPAE